jgi:phosphatidylethanolamine/phosphatidyl-N-methylethanolamine N-methyltransferase
MGKDVDKNTITKAYACWAPSYDFVFGAVFERARRAAIVAAERTGGRILEVGVGTGISPGTQRPPCWNPGRDPKV